MTMVFKSRHKLASQGQCDVFPFTLNCTMYILRDTETDLKTAQEKAMLTFVI